ncbi:Long-chain fatty acid transporter [Georgfuchsia toluolica]|uniref:Long-chain fatty acid transporter n=1 Tax=Georgfuchsia toluolica TaxID=424218 RepID=A0A916N9Q5_9PROT|nr:outer membrane protein transport protein [Georgfuchsia toluolica]CAG4884909.1 Long-chain fatty acid transporter [Georgfuchsia toluolica]
MKNIHPILLPALFASIFSSTAGAAGFQLLEQNASGMGNAYAGSAAVADNASTIFYNPAGMTQLKAREYSVGVAAIEPSFKFHDGGSSVGALAGTGNGGDGGRLGFVPNGYLSWAYDKDLYLGIGFGAPFGLMTKYDKPWLGAAQATSFDVKTYNINPSIAYRVNDTVSVGGGVSWQRLEAEYKRQAGVVALFGPGTAPLAAATPLKLTLDDEAWGWNVGALFKLSPASKLGISYRSRIKYDLSGKIEASGPVGAVNAAIASDAKASLELPDTVIASLTHQCADQWEGLADLSWTGWSSIPKIDIRRTSGAGSGTVAQTLDTDFRDTWRLALGANYKMREDLKLKFGVAYDETPVKNASTRLVSLPDNNRIWLSFGTQWKPVKDSALDVGAAYLIMQDASINNNQAAAGRGQVTGTYKDSSWLLGVQYSASF